MEVGFGVHGERGVGRKELSSADEVGRLLAERIVDDLECSAGSRVRGFDQWSRRNSATRAILDLPANSRESNFQAERNDSPRSYVGEFLTSLQMAGVSVTIVLLDEELLSLLDAPCKTVRIVQ